MKIAIVGIITITIIGGGVWLVANSGSDEPAVNSGREGDPSSAEMTDNEAIKNESKDEHIITYTDNGFSPSSLNISVGQSVTFINESSRSMWVASDLHPTHNDLPEFDAGRGVGAGDTYNFIFNQAGSWGFHNHLAPSHLGQITVR